ncbi:hypothetical protein C8F01DRAFT_1369014 [Mycena amicta]|nr:hypothetical protein C8F01DRAFT_1369014 [Mycena amicta]
MADLPGEQESSRSPLAGELIESIIDNLHAVDALSGSYSLISRLWLPRNRHYRFASLTLEVGSDPRNRYSLLKTQQLLELASNPLATFIPHVKWLRLVHKWDVRVDGPVLSPREIMSTLEKCGVAPTTLSLDCLRLSNAPRPPELGSPAFTSCVKILHLALEDNYEAITHYFCAFPHLETLELQGTPNMVDDILPTAVEVPPLLKSVSMTDRRVLEWLCALEAFPPQLKHLELNDLPHHTCEWSQVNECLQGSIGSNIQELTLRDCGAGLDKTIPDLQHLQTLRHLTIHSDFTPAADFLEILLQNDAIPGHNLTQLTLSLGFLSIGFLFSGATYDPRTWMALDESLSDASLFPHLTNILITTHNPPSEYLNYHLSMLVADAGMPLVEALHAHMTKCGHGPQGRGLLKVDTERIPVVQPGPRSERRLPAFRVGRKPAYRPER